MAEAVHHILDIDGVAGLAVAPTEVGITTGVFTAFFTRPQTWTSKRARDPRK